MGYGIINVWVRERNDCCVVDMNGYAWAQCCGDREKLIETELRNGHAELKVPPGCYIVDASWKPGCCGDAKETMVIVGCGETVCVNLIREWAGDPIARISAFSTHGAEAGLSSEKIDELVNTLSAIAKTVPEERVRYFSEKELEIKRRLSDEPHRKTLDKFSRILTGKD